MKLTTMASLLASRLAMPLPGDTAHKIMRARFTDNTFPNFAHKVPPRPGAVLILLYPDGDKIRFPIIRRQEYVGAHSGQVSLPGGKSEPGETAVETALRETDEEIGVDRTLPKVIGALSNFFVMPSNFIITPIVATLDHAPVFWRDEYEVADILSADLETLLNDDAVTEAEILTAGQHKMIAPHFLLAGAIVWGATAMMLNELRVVLREALLEESQDLN